MSVKWGEPPWQIPFKAQQKSLPAAVDFAVIGAGFTGLAAAAWLRLLAPEKSVAVFEAGTIGTGASGRTGGMALAETAAGDQPGLGDVLAGVQSIFAKLSDASGFSIAERAELSLGGAWEIGRKDALPNSAIQWTDSGTLRVVGEVPGGTIHPAKLVASLAQAAETLGAAIFEHNPVEQVVWSSPAKLRTATGKEITARKILFATNGMSLSLAGYGEEASPRLTLAAATAPLSPDVIEQIGLGARKPFYTVDLPYLWGRLMLDSSIIWGAGLVNPPSSNNLRQVDVASSEPARLFASIEKRIRGLHPALADVRFTHTWGGPILFREKWTPVLDWHPQSRDAAVAGAYAGHGVMLSSYFGAWAAEALLDRRDLPPWAALRP